MAPKRFLSSIRLLLVLGSIAVLYAQQPTYHVTDLGTLGQSQSFANAISPNGTYVVGTYNTPGGQVNTAFLWSSANGAVSLGTLGGVSLANGVNNSGQVAGSSVTGQNHAYLYSNGVMQDLGTLGTGSSAYSYGQGLNNSGQVVGYSNPNPDTNFHQNDAFLYSGTMQDLGLPSGATNSYAAAIDDSGAIAGYFNPDSASTHVFLLVGGVYKDLGTLQGNTLGAVATASAISANGLVAGSSTLANGSTHAFLYIQSQMMDLGTLSGTVSRASGVNSNGDVVGESFWSGSGFHGFLYHGGALLDVNSLLDAASSGYTITDASGISEGGAIAATGLLPGGMPGDPSHALLLTPVSVSPQTITFDAIPNQTLGISPFAVAVEASSALPVTIASTTPAVCKNSTNLVTLLTAGACSLTATQNGNVSYSAATAVTRTFTVSMANASGALQAAANPLAVGGKPESVAVGDFNGDGRPDLATANYNDGTVTVLIANLSGGYTAATGSPFSVGTNPQSVAVGDFNGDGHQDLAVANFGSNNVTILLGDGMGGFAAATGSPVTAGTQPVSAAVGDFNGDGVQDLAIANSGGGSVSILLGNGSGGFTAANGSPFPVGSNPSSIAVGDFNGDGAQDLAVANLGDGTVTVLLANMSGGFTAPTGSPFNVGSMPYSVAVGDFNADGKADLAIANSHGNNVTVLMGNGSGGFSAFTGSPFSVGTTPYAVAVADFNGDGIPDLATANFGGSNISVLLGNGSGGFSAIAGGAIAAGSAPFSLEVADFNGDNIPDLAVANSGDGNVTLLLGGKVATTSTLTTGSPSVVALGQAVPLTLTVADNATPIATLTGTATFLDNNASLGTAAQTTSPYTFSTSSLTAGSHTLSASYSGDAGTLGSTSNTITIQVSATLTAQTITFGALSNQTLGTTPPALTATASSGLAAVFTSNSLPVCTVSGTAITLVAQGTCSITANQPGNGQFAPAFPVTQTFLVLQPSTITFDAIANQIYGVAPFITTAKASSHLPVSFVSNTPSVCSNAGSLILLLNAGTCSISASQPGNASFGAAPTVTRSFTVAFGPSGALSAAGGSPFAAGTSPNAMAVADVNGDGNPDLIVANQGSNNLTLLLGDGMGGFTAESGGPIPVGAAPGSVAAGDFNGDGKADIAVANFNDGTVTVLLGDGAGAFTASTGSPFQVGKQPGGVVIGDFNDDGVQDLATANNGDGTTTVLLGDGAGAFTAASGSPFPAGTSAKALAVGDFNADGVQDLAIADEAFAAGTATVLLGNGGGGFTAASGSPFSAGFLPGSLAVGDFNRDGFPDLAAPSLVFNNVAVLLGTRTGAFTSATGSPFGSGSTPLAVAVGDFNGDGFPDIAVANSGGGSVTLLFGNGIGGFTQALGSPFPAGSGASALAVGDFNKDGIEDLAIANASGGNVTVLLGGTISTTSVLTTSAASTIFVGQAVPLTLTVSDSATPFSPLTGTATLLDGATALGTATQTGSPYTFDAMLSAGTHTLSASYGGGSGSAPSTSNTISIPALSRCDLNQDQATNLTDLNLALSQGLGVSAAANDLNADGAVNVVDVQIVLNAVNLLGCSASVN
ncbi:MAG TPA: FG-GAP-like repeat-containing protein [Bryobacteraceae bacterium]|nr:FG-GAP-like repeat-containing protein [Bryobacteraceae bacterium]